MRDVNVVGLLIIGRLAGRESFVVAVMGGWIGFIWGLGIFQKERRKKAEMSYLVESGLFETFC